MDWATYLLVVGGALALLWTVVALLFPVFGGPWVSREEYLGLVMKIAGIVFAATGLAPFAIVWAFRGVVEVLRWAICPC